MQHTGMPGEFVGMVPLSDASSTCSMGSDTTFDMLVRVPTLFFFLSLSRKPTAQTSLLLSLYSMQTHYTPLFISFDATHSAHMSSFSLFSNTLHIFSSSIISFSLMKPHISLLLSLSPKLPPHTSLLPLHLFPVNTVLACFYYSFQRVGASDSVSASENGGG